MTVTAPISRPAPGDRLLMRCDDRNVDWTISDGLVAYEDALLFMESRVKAIAEESANECVWLLEHPPLYTAGTSAAPADLSDPGRFPVHKTGRGGQYTYHGPGQRIAYVMLDLKAREPDIRRFVNSLESWIIAALARFNVCGERRVERIGVWVSRPDKSPPGSGVIAEDKIAAIGIRLRRWVSFHGISLNVDPDLEHYSGIVPCGIRDHGVTSLHDLGVPVSMPEVDMVLREEFHAIFGKSKSRVRIA